MNRYRVVVNGDPIPQGRPRLTTINGHARAYDPAKSRNYKQLIKLMAQQHAPDEPTKNPVILSVLIYRKIPKSFSKKKREQIDLGLLRPTTKPDVSNVIKGVEDALNGVWYKDDSQIVAYGKVGKWYSDTPRVEITMEVLDLVEGVSC